MTAVITVTVGLAPGVVPGDVAAGITELTAARVATSIFPAPGTTAIVAATVFTATALSMIRQAALRAVNVVTAVSLTAGVVTGLGVTGLGIFAAGVAALISRRAAVAVVSGVQRAAGHRDVLPGAVGTRVGHSGIAGILGCIPPGRWPETCV